MPELVSWSIFAIAIFGLLALDLFVFHREAKPVSMREASVWVTVWVSLGLAFGAFIFLTRGATSGGEYLAGYLIEYSLSMDNVFVFAVLFAYFAVPAQYQHRLLFWGVLGAIVFRAVFILAGTALLEAFHVVVYVFGALLLFTAWRMVTAGTENVDPNANPFLRLMRRVIPVTEGYQGQRFFVRRDGRLWATPLFAALVVIESSDIMFAIDSVPAILSITTDTFIVFTSNAFAIMGLRSLYFLLAGLIDRFEYLKYGLAALLAFAGVKMLLSDVIHLDVWVSLGIIVAILGSSIVISLMATRSVGSGAPRGQVRVGSSLTVALVVGALIAASALLWLV
ncbi:MAG TPA: TerC family protein [Candidatus Limnocylindria bacterium]|nr:TerC family protein [Candidatus Limnocylindria bacterium]